MHTCYISYNATDDIGYVGYELGSGDSYYYGSSQLPMFLHAKRNGLLKKYILGRFEQEFTARNAESFAIKKLRNGGLNLYNRNEGGGGNEGALGDYRVLDISFREVIDGIISDRKFPDLRERSSNRKMADAAIGKLESGDYIRFDEHISTLTSYIAVQTRHTQIDQLHVRNLYDSMINDPELFRKKTGPIVVVVDDRETLKNYILGGNHRLTAAIDAGWDTFPTVYVNFDEFNYNMKAAKLFGVHDNLKNGIHQKFLNTDDIRVLIEEHMKEYPEYPLTSFEFKQSFVEEYLSNQLSEKKLSINLANFIKKKQEQELISEHNFHQYRKEELEAIKTHLSMMECFADAVILSDEVPTLQNNGIGGILNMLGKNKANATVYGKETKKTGVIFARYTSPRDTQNSDSFFKDFDNAMQIAGFVTTDMSVWTNDRGYKINLIVLPHKHEEYHVTRWKGYQKAIEECLRNEKVKSLAA
jgi:hypothetical protein